MTHKTFSQWLKTHYCTAHELWLLQNMLGDCLGWDHPLHVEARKAWSDTSISEQRD